MPPQYATARLDVDLSALLANYRALQKRTPGAEVAPVVKADAYGLGCEAIAGHLARHGAQTFFVARLDEGVALRRYVGSGFAIYVLDGLSEPAVFAAHDLQPVLNSIEQYQQWIAGSNTLKAALHIDTGMNRLGIRPEDITALPARGTHALTLVMSHLARGDEPDHTMNAQQLMAFGEAAGHFAGIPLSLANSSGSFLGHDYGFDLTRPGISLYGGGPFGVAHPDIQAVATLKARILQTRDVKAGETVGYGAGFTAAKDMRVATIGLGYADGLLRSLAAHGSVTINGVRRPLTGRVSMDVFSIDVTGLDVMTDDWVEVLGALQNLDQVATAAGTIGYDLLTRIGARVPRHYT